ncbi:hypothetical protein NQZ68_032701 [Dissostichus eleginoides]|nr:hypothetical protein NQZ68_032701 [Dissostichus eleginoides]
MEPLCNCSGLNITPHFLTVNITSQSPRHVGKVSHGGLSTPHMETFDPEVLFNLFLPPIIFHGAYTLNQKRLIGNLGSVLTFAICGTVISCFTIGSCVYGFTRLMVLLGRAADGDFLLTDCLLFGAIVSATDPVAVLGLLSELRLDLDLHSLLFGESVLNDAVAIVLTQATPHMDTSLCDRPRQTGRWREKEASVRIVVFTLWLPSLCTLKCRGGTNGHIGLRLFLEWRDRPSCRRLSLDWLPAAWLHSQSWLLLASHTGPWHWNFNKLSKQLSFTLMRPLSPNVLLQKALTQTPLSQEVLPEGEQEWDNPLLETSVFFLLSWSCFLAAKASGLSGIVAVLFCGLSQARYTLHNLSSEGRTRTKQLFEVFNFLGEIFIFSYMGYVLLTFPRHVFKALFITGAFLSICISRACNIYPLSFLLNLGRTTKIPRSFQHFMMFAGFRGAVAFSLAVRDTSTEARRTILSTTLLLVGFTTWVLGTSADPMLRLLNIRVGVDSDGDETPEDLSFEVATGRPDTTRGLWHRLDYKFLKPLLTHCGPPLTDTLPQCCGLFVRLFSCPHVQEDEEQVCEADPDDSTFDLEKTEERFGSEGGDSGSAHQEDLLEGDLGLGTDPPAIA